MMTEDEIKEILTGKMSGAQISVQDMTGTQDHFEVTVVSREFQGKSLIEQHKLVHQALSGPLEDGRIHALKIKTYTPDRAPASN